MHETEKLALTLVENFHKGEGGKVERVRATKFRRHFVDGVLWTIGFDLREKGKLEEDLENYVYIVDGDAKVLLDDEELINAIDGRRRSLLFELFSSRGISGVIALLVVSVLIVAVFTIDDPDLKKQTLQALIGGFALVLGYFFGKST